MEQKQVDHHAEAVRDEYAGLASDYDIRWGFYIRATVQETVAWVTPRPGDRVLEVGCGTGAFLHALGRRCPETKLAGIDPVPEMLAIARERLPSGVELQEAWNESLPFPVAAYEWVVSCNMFHYVSQPEQALAEMKRVLAPGGELVLTDWCDDYLSCKLCDWYLRRFNPAHYKVYGMKELRELVEAAGFEGVRMERYKINWLWGLMTARASKPDG